MNKITFIKQLTDGLKKLGIIDIEEIIKDYEAHFENELLKGRTEEEISKALGRIDDILIDFSPENEIKKQRKLMNTYSVILSDIFIYLGMLSLYIVNLALLQLALSSLLLSMYTMFSMNFFNLIPNLIFPFSLVVGLAFLALTLASFGLSAMLFKYLNILMKRLGLWHKQILKGQYLHQFISVNQSKIMKRISLWSGLAFILLFIITYIVGFSMTNNPQFWETWHWFN